MFVHLDNDYFDDDKPDLDDIMHYGVPGMKWGVRKSGIRRNGPLTGSFYNIAGGKLVGSHREKKYNKAQQTGSAKRKAKTGQRYLTSLDKLRAQTTADADVYSTKANKAESKISNRNSSKKNAKYREKSTKYKTKAANNAKTAAWAKKQINSVLSKYGQNKYSVYSSYRARVVSNTKAIVASYLTGELGDAYLMYKSLVTARPGTQYKIKAK